MGGGEIFVRNGLLKGVYTLTASVLRHGDTDNPLGSLIKHCRLYFLTGLGKVRATGQDCVGGAATTLGTVEFEPEGVAGRKRHHGRYWRSMR